MPTKDNNKLLKSQNSRWRECMYEVIFNADTPVGKAFDIALLWAIIFSIIVVMLESVSGIEMEYGSVLRMFEWIFTIIFTIEYIARIVSADRPFRYIFSFLGIVDLIAVIPTYMSLFMEGSQYLMVMRTIRLLRVFRILKLSRYLGEERLLLHALKASRYKITVFLVAVFSMVVIMGTLMYLIEGADNGFTSIPKSIYWAIVTLTTVGYGDIAPKTVPGQALASIIMILGYGIIAVPTGIVTVELAQAKKEIGSSKKCAKCFSEGLDSDSNYCKHCGAKL